MRWVGWGGSWGQCWGGEAIQVAAITPRHAGTSRRRRRYRSHFPDDDPEKVVINPKPEVISGDEDLILAMIKVLH